MRDEHERFERHPGEEFSQRLVFTRIEEIADRMTLLNEKLDRISKMLAEALRKKESYKVLTPVSDNVTRGFEPEDEVD